MSTIHYHPHYPAYCGAEGPQATNDKQVDCPQCKANALLMPDINHHPLTPFFKAIAVEYYRGMAKHGDWAEISEAMQIKAIVNEYCEWDEAFDKGDVDGEHGEINELTHLANVAGKRWEQLKNGK